MATNDFKNDRKNTREEFNMNDSPNSHSHKSNKNDFHRVSPTSIDYSNFNENVFSSFESGVQGQACDTPNSKDRRRERNRILAKKNRMRKKIELDTMQDKLCLLQNELDRVTQERNELKIMSIQSTASTAPPSAPFGLTIQYDRRLSAQIMTMLHSMIGMPNSLSGDSQCSAETLHSYVEQRPFYVVGVTGHSYPIIYASPGFSALTGYDVHAIIGRNCGFLHGPHTDKNEVQKLNKGITEGQSVSSKLVNYRRDGSTFFNQVQLGHIKDITGKTAYIVGVHSKISRSASTSSFDPRMLDAFVSDFVVTASGITAATFHTPSAAAAPAQTTPGNRPADDLIMLPPKQQRGQLSNQQHQTVGLRMIGAPVTPTPSVLRLSTPSPVPSSHRSSGSGMTRNKSSSALLNENLARQFQLDEEQHDERSRDGDDSCSLSSVSCDDFSMDGEGEGEGEDGDSGMYSYSRVADDMDGIRIVSPNTTAVAASVSRTPVLAVPTRSAPAIPAVEAPLGAPNRMWQTVPPQATRPTAHPISAAHDPFNVHRPGVPSTGRQTPQYSHQHPQSQVRSQAVTTQQPTCSPQPYSFKGYKAHYGNRGAASGPTANSTREAQQQQGQGQESNFRLLSTAELERDLLVCGGYFMGGQPI